MARDSARQAAVDRMLVEHLQGRGIRDVRVLAALAQVPRERFVPEEARQFAFADRALPIECGQTISQPYMVALMTEALKLTGAERVLEIGAGTGYQSAVLSKLSNHVVSIERHAELAEAAARRLTELGCRNVEIHVGDGTRGWLPQAPYDGILVAAAAEQCPAALLEQLAEGGRLVIPLGERDEQMLTLLQRSGSEINTTPLVECRFVPLVSD